MIMLSTRAVSLQEKAFKLACPIFQTVLSDANVRIPPTCPFSFFLFWCFFEALSVTNRRSEQKIKQDLIRKAQLNKELSRARAAVETAPQHTEVQEPTFIEPHPDRQALMDAEEPAQQPEPRERHRERRPKSQTFAKEAYDAERRRKDREVAESTHKQKILDRQRFRKAVAKARKPGKDGKRKLGRESLVLLEKVKKLVGT
jgi:hypothetical protein